MVRCKYTLNCRMHSEAVPILDDSNKHSNASIVYASFRVYYCHGNPGTITDKPDFKRHLTTDEERRTYCQMFRLFEKLESFESLIGQP